MRIIYVTHNGIGTALVRSQVLPYLRLLSLRGHEIDLVTFERGDPYPDGEFPRDRWHPLRPRGGRRLFAKLLDITLGVWVVGLLARRRRAAALHARSYVPAAICSVVAQLFRLPYIFDMRGFMGEEYVDAGIWHRGDVRHRALRFAERHILRSAARIVVLTHAAARRLRTDPLYRAEVRSREVAVIPCAVDLERFQPNDLRYPVPTVVYSGSLGMWYMLDEMLRVYAHAREIESCLRFVFLNRNEHALIRAAWSAARLPPDAIEVRACDFGQVPRELARCHVAIALLQQVPSKIGSSPIKIGEYLACGLPVVVNQGLGDSDDQIRNARAGHVVPSYDERSLTVAGAALVGLIRDKDVRSRARALAESIFDVGAGAEAYDRVYAGLERRPGAPR